MRASADRCSPWTGDRRRGPRAHSVRSTVRSATERGVVCEERLDPRGGGKHPELAASQAVRNWSRTAANGGRGRRPARRTVGSGTRRVRRRLRDRRQDGAQRISLARARVCERTRQMFVLLLDAVRRQDGCCANWCACNNLTPPVNGQVPVRARSVCAGPSTIARKGLHAAERITVGEYWRAGAVLCFRRGRERMLRP